jgi:hypothetical protein
LPVGADASVFAAAVAAAVDALPVAAPWLAGGIEALVRGRLSAGVAQLAGRGPGLTPAGDDVLAGFVAARFVLDGGRPGLSLRAAGRCSPLGLAYLRCAERGELPDPAARLLDAFGSGSIRDVRVACAELRVWGASSGTALGWGITAAFRQCLATESARRKIQVT